MRRSLRLVRFSFLTEDLGRSILLGLVGCAIALTLGSFNPPSIAQDSPTFYSGRWPDRNGDFPIRQTYHGTWQVADPDSKGLNCRANIPPSADSDTIVTTFPKDTLLNTVKRERGVFEIGEDRQGFPWLRVQLHGGGKRECWVRANRKYVVPIKSEIVF
ncbi:MAG: hypothetical protein ACRC8A_11800 [Microcoleaceae cyanobacterium]